MQRISRNHILSPSTFDKLCVEFCDIWDVRTRLFLEFRFTNENPNECCSNTVDWSKILREKELQGQGDKLTSMKKIIFFAGDGNSILLCRSLQVNHYSCMDKQVLMEKCFCWVENENRFHIFDLFRNRIIFQNKDFFLRQVLISRTALTLRTQKICEILSPHYPWIGRIDVTTSWIESKLYCRGCDFL